MTMNDLDNSARELFSLEPIEVDQARIFQKTAEKLGLSSAPNSSKASQGPRRRVLKAFAIAAVLVAFTGTVAFAGYSALQLGEHPLGFFSPDSASTTAVSAPTYRTAAMGLESYNAEVGQSIAVDGATITLDTVAVDDNFINAFFTIVYDEPLELDDSYEGEHATGAGEPNYARLSELMPWFEFKIDGEVLPNAFSQVDDRDPYLADERTVKLMVHYLIPTLIPDVFSLGIGVYSPFDNGAVSFGSAEAPSEFNLSIDKTNSALATKTVEPATYTFDAGEGVKPLNIEKFAITPFGSVFTVSAAHAEWTGIGPKGLEVDVAGPDALFPQQFYITDNLGNVAYINGYAGMSSNPYGTSYYPVELYGLSPEATSVTLTPLRWKGFEGSSFEPRSYAIAEVGQRIETSSIGGLVYDGCEITGSRMTYRFTPYGYTYIGDVIPGDVEMVSLTTGSRLGLAFHTFDATTGQFVYTIDYYAATPEELQSIKTFSIYYDDSYEIDTAAAVTLPLK